MPELNIFVEANRQLVICNACRYCEGYCPVFRAIEVRREYIKGDVFYLSNLCHDCRACYYACMYSPPHEFAINIPKVLSEARVASYGHWSWPAFFGRAYKDSKFGALVALVASIVVMAAGFLLIPSSTLFAKHVAPGGFYELIPYLAMVVPAIALVVYGALSWSRSGLRFWIETENVEHPPLSFAGLLSVVREALGLRYLKGGGPGCSYPGEAPSASRRIFHALVFWGFLSDFVSTTLAYVYQDFFHWFPPYPVASAPVIFGSAGGISLVIGVIGLIKIKLKSDPDPAGAGAYGLDYIFLAVLGLTAVTGLLTLMLRATTALGSLLVVHLALVAALFLTAPYGKFVHALYRVLALIRYHMEEGQSVHKA